MYAQHGGILIKEGRTSKEAYTYFIDNSICELITFETKGGLLFKITLKNQSIKFKIQDSVQSNKRIFLGKFGSNKNIVTSSSGIRIYLFDKNNKIIEV